MSQYDRNAYAPFGTSAARSGAVYDQGLRSYMLGIYNHMTVALAISALVALGAFMISTTTGPTGRMALTPIGQALYVSPLKWVIMLAPLAFVFLFSFRFEKMSYQSLMTTFYAFAAVMGLSLGTIFLVYTAASVVQVLLITAASFGALSLFGYTTKRNLSAMGSFLVMGLFGLIIAGLVNIFMQSSALQFAINVLGVGIFAGLTAWDTQKLKEQYDYVSSDSELMAKSSIMGALTLYLDFINMFQFLLSLLGNRNNN
ncbi:MAG: Bax inhibitor-1/YccA family protein [Alsobacter sp.]